MHERGKPLRFDYQNAFADSDGQTYPFCLPDAFRRIVLQVIDRALWSATVWDGIELSESERQTIERGIYALTAQDGCMGEIEDMVTITINNTNTNNATGGAGGAGGSSTIPVYTGGAGGCECLPLAPPGSETPPPVIINPGTPPPGWPDYNAYDAARCAIANYGWQLVYEWLTALSNVTESALALAAFVFFLINFAPGLVFALFSAGAIAALLSFLAQLSAYTQPFDDFFDDILSYWVENRQDIICQGYNAQSEIPLYESLFTALSDYLDGIWTARAYSETLVYILSRVLQYALPSSVFGLLLLNEDEDFFGTYQAPVPCDCGTIPPTPGAGDWIFVLELGNIVANALDPNNEDEFSNAGVISGGGPGSSFQTWRVIKDSFDGVDPGDYTHVAISGTLAIQISGAATEWAQGRQVRIGSPNEYTLAADFQAAANESTLESVSVTFWIGLDGQALPGTFDIEQTYVNPSYLMPSIRLVSSGYHMANTAYEITLTDFQIITA